MPRYTKPHRAVGITDASPALIDLGKQLLGYLAQQQALGAPKTLSIRRDTPEGTVIARMVYGVPDVQYLPLAAKGGTEEVIYLYVGASDGLRIYDLGTKTRVRTVTGLGNYLLQDVNRDGNIAHLTYSLGTSIAQLVRLDIRALSAIGNTYTVKTADSPDTNPPIDGLATNQDGDATAVSPDEKTLLYHFGGSATTADTLREGIGGLLLIDATTLLPVRATPIRMTFKPAPMAWRPDGARFFLACTLSDDVGDIPATTRLADLAASQHDYVSVFDATGGLLGSRLLATWAITPDAGFDRTIKGIAATNDRVYVTVRGESGFTTDPVVPMLYVLDATDTTLPVVAAMSLASVSATGAPANLCLSRGGGTLYLSYADRVAEVSVARDVLSIAYVTADATLATWSPSRVASFPEVQLGPLSRFGAAPDDRKFFFNFDSTVPVAVVRGYGSFKAGPTGAPQPVYAFDLAADGITFKHGYRLANVGSRPLSRNDA